MALKNGINKFNEDKQKLKNAAGSQAISPLTEKTLNGNNNPDSTKMAGTAAAQQGVANQQAKDPTAVQNGALAQQQDQQVQQRNLQAEAKSVADFRSEGVEKAQEAAAQKSEKWASDMAQFGSLGQRVSTAVQEEMAAGGEVAAQFEVNHELMDNATKTLSTPGNEVAARGVMDNVIGSLQSGDSAGAVQNLIDNAQLFNVDTTNSAAALTTIFEALEIDPSQQQAMVSDALAEGIVNPEQMNMQFLLDQGILTTDNAQIPELGLSVAEIEEMVGPDWKDMTVEQIEGELELKFDDESERDDIMRELANPNIDPTRKAELHRELQLLGASGQAESEAMAGRGLERVSKANQVVMGDELKSVEDVLSDDAVKTVSNDLMMRIQEDPENAAAILEQWKQDNPGYEAMGDWVKDSIDTLGDKEAMFKDASEMVEAKNKEAADFVNDNELFGSTEGAKDILETLGFNTEGFGAMGNDPSQNPTYQALTSYKESNPDQFAMFQQNLVNMDPEDMEGLNGADINTIMETLGTKEGMEEFNYLRELNNKLAITDTNNFAGVMSSILPQGHPLHDITSSPKAAQEYLGDLRKMKDLGVLTPELEAFSNLMDADGDGKLDDTADIAGQIKKLVGEDGINMSNFQGGDAKELMGMMDQGVVNIKDIVADKTMNWANEQAGKKKQFETDSKKVIADTTKQAKSDFSGGDKSLGAFYDSFGGITKPGKADAAISKLLGKPNQRQSASLSLAKKLGITPPAYGAMQLGIMEGNDTSGSRKKAAQDRKTKASNAAKLKKFYADVRAKMTALKGEERKKQISAVEAAKKNIGYDAKSKNPWENF